MGKIIFVYAEDKLGNIGYNGGLPWYLPSELERFKSLTLNGVVVMGRKTFESLPKGPLPDRVNIVVSKTLKINSNQYKPEVKVIPNLNYIKDLLDKNLNIFIIGGTTLFNNVLLNFKIDIIYRTIVMVNTIGDTKSPIIDFKKVGLSLISSKTYTDSKGYYIDSDLNKVKRNINYKLMVYKRSNKVYTINSKIVRTNIRRTPRHLTITTSEALSKLNVSLGEFIELLLNNKSLPLFNTQQIECLKRKIKQ